MATLFMGCLICGIFSCVMTLLSLIQERGGIYRDIDMNLVNPLAYVISYTLIDIPVSLLSSYLL